MSLYFAHSTNYDPAGWQKLEDHLECVAEKAARFASPFKASDWAFLAGLWHDLGKYSPDFQRRLHGENISVVHSNAGGHWAQQLFSDQLVARVFCWLIMGHHAGLADYPSDRTGAKALLVKMEAPERSVSIIDSVPSEIKTQEVPTPPPMLSPGGRQASFAFLIRMLFSCLVDADFLDTEAFLDKKRKRLRDLEYPTIEQLLVAFDAHMADLCGKKPLSKVNEIRNQVLSQCRSAAEQEPTVFSLTVPTGGGKTLSSLAFALRHAVKHRKRRIIYVIPYTSIIEQTASVFRKISGFEEAVLEHHSNLVEAEDETEACMRARLASENWDAPIIVTTNVQFFESLYACKTSRCRKLHNIVDSVVIFDEAQSLPSRFLRPVAHAIRELNRHYSVTPVLCTATQPVLEKAENFDFKFKEGFDSVTEIVSAPDALTTRLQRVRVERFRDLAPVHYTDIGEALRAENQSVLCIVNRKDDARELARLLPEEQTIHLSTNMCPAHRFRTMETIRQSMGGEDAPLLVISTSLVEAGVDLDFPVVYRALAGLDSIAQAAGRCNREGMLALGKTVVFVPVEQPDYVKSAASLAREFLAKDRLPDIFQPETFCSYFQQRFFQLGESALDEEGILDLLPQNLDNIYFRTAAERFRLIQDDWQQPLIVPFDDSLELVNRLQKEPWNGRHLFRQLQRYTINVDNRLLSKLFAEGHTYEIVDYPGTWVLGNRGLYDDCFGFVPPDKIDSYNPEDLMA